jgi:hypothetical protein
MAISPFQLRHHYFGAYYHYINPATSIKRNHLIFFAGTVRFMGLDNERWEIVGIWIYTNPDHKNQAWMLRKRSSHGG